MQHWRNNTIDVFYYKIWSSNYAFNAKYFFNYREIYKSYIVLPISEKVINLWVYLECGTM